MTHHAQKYIWTQIHTSFSSSISLSLSWLSFSPEAQSGVMERSRHLPGSGDWSRCDVVSRVCVWQMCILFEESELELDVASTSALPLLFSNWRRDSLFLRHWEIDSILSCDWLRESVVVFSSASAFCSFWLRSLTSVDSSRERDCSLDRS